MYNRVGEMAGAEKQAQIFAGIHLPPLGTPSREKARLTQVVMERLDHLVDVETQSRIFRAVSAISRMLIMKPIN